MKFSFGVLLLVFTFYTNGFSKAIEPLSHEEERVIGREIAANVIAQFGIYTNESLTDYVNLVGLTLARGVKDKRIKFHFAILDTKIVNAFAAPGGYIFITRGLLNLLQNEAELAGVLAHEIAHVSQRHVAKSIQKQKLVEAAIPSYVKAAAKKAVHMQQVTNLAINISWKGLSKEDELESDRLALAYMTSAGYDTESFANVLKLLHRISKGKSSNQLKFLLSTHPKPAVRIKAAKTYLKKSPSKGKKLQHRFEEVVKNTVSSREE